MTERPSTGVRSYATPQLEAFIARALGAVGLPPSDAAEVARLMVRADLRGADGHGIFRLPQYVRRIRAGAANVRPRVGVARGTQAMALGARGNGLGHLRQG